MVCFCGKTVVVSEAGAVSKHRPKKNFQPRFFEMSRKARKNMWCDVESRMSNVQQRVMTVNMPILDVLKQRMEAINLEIELANA